MNQAALTALSLRSLLEGLAPVPGRLACDVTGLANDSRRVRPGDLFLATRGLHHHGLEFLPAVRAAGAAAVAWEPPYEGPVSGGGDRGLPLIAVQGLGRKLGLIAERFYGEPCKSLEIVGITGTDGKTSCAHFIAQSLDACGLLGTLGYGVHGQLRQASHTTPDAVTLWCWLAQLRDRGMRRVAMEISSHALDQGRVAGLRCTVAVLTHLTRDHLDYHGSLAAYAAAKSRLFLEQPPGCAVLNMDDALGRQLALQLMGSPTKIIGYGLRQRSPQGLDAFVWGQGLDLSATGLEMQVLSSWGSGRLSTQLLGRFNASNLLAALAALRALAVPFTEALQRLSRVSTVPGRMERFGGSAGKPLIVVDYAHTPYALEQVLRALREHGRGRLWCVFGCGGDRDFGKRPLMGGCVEQFADRIIVTDDNPRTEDPQQIVQHILAGIKRPDRVKVLRDRAAAIRSALNQAAAEDSVLIAGKGHEDYQIIGDERFAFSDPRVVTQWLAERP